MEISCLRFENSNFYERTLHRIQKMQFILLTSELLEFRMFSLQINMKLLYLYIRVNLLGVEPWLKGVKI